MDKPNPSSAGPWVVLVSLLAMAQSATALTLSENEALRIGKKIWQNECGGTVSGLTSWNEGEDFASLGIGHFIWYPKDRSGPFEESFPQFLAFVGPRGGKLPPLSRGGADLHCPWNSRAEFMQAQQGPEMTQLRQFLVATVDLQSQFLAQRLQNALPKMLADIPAADRSRVEQEFLRVSSSRHGPYALIDYVNFKGEGVLPTERYNDQGWGLLQVLQEMHGTDSDPAKEFSRAAAIVLKRRVANSPPARHESRWLSGWLNRVNSYSRD